MKFHYLTRTVAALAITGVAAGPLAAGTVYVGAALSVTEGALSYSTEVTISNPTFEAHEFTVYEIPEAADGSDRPEGGVMLTPITVMPGQTLVLNNLTDADEASLLEVTADPELVIGSRLATTFQGAEQLGAQVPVISSENVFAGGTLYHIQGWERSSSRKSSLGLINLSQSANPCTIDILAVGGAPLIPRTQLTLPPLSQFYFPDPLQAIGVMEGTDIRVQLRCDRQSYAYTHVRDTSNGDMKLLSPSITGQSTFQAPGTEEPCPDNAVCIDVPSFVPVPGNDIFEMDLPGLQQNAIYSRVRVSMNFTHGGWDPISPDGLHGLFWLYRNGVWRGNTFGYPNVRGPNRNLVTQLVNVNQPAGVTIREVVSALLNPGQTYQLDYVYDGPARVFRTVVRTLGGDVVAEIATTTPTNRVPIQDGFTIQIAQHREIVEVPTIGWNYFNIRVTFE